MITEPGDTTEGLEAAIDTLLDAGQALTSADERVINVIGEDKGTTIKFPVVILGNEVRSLQTEARTANEVARATRLLNADGPDRREGTAVLQSVVSLCDHTNRFKGEDSAIWADASCRRIVSVLDYHRKGPVGVPRWGKHRGIYQATTSDAWIAWGAGKQLALGQEEFAAFLDARDREIVSGQLPNGKAAPDPSSLITLASNLETYSSAKAKRERDPNTGRLKVGFSSESGFLGDIMPPPSFLISIPVFSDGERETIEIRLHVAVVDATATFKIQIHAANDILRDSFKEISEAVRDATAIPLFVGTPE